MAKVRSVVATVQLTEQRMGPGFSSFGLRGLPGRSLDPFLNVDDFRMSLPTFPPHPHAGFSAVTYLFEDSAGAFINRDSLGDRSRIAPGGLHWTQAGSGMLHEEIPEKPGIESHGLQMFVNLRSDHKLAAPRAFRVEAADVPVAAAEGSRVRVLAGSYGGATSPLAGLATPVLLLDVLLIDDGRVTLPIDPAWSSFALAIAGHGRAGAPGAEVALPAHGAAGFDDDGDAIALAGPGRGEFRVLVAAGAPIREPVVFGGPFAMTSRADVEAANARFRRGEMGALAPTRGAF